MSCKYTFSAGVCDQIMGMVQKDQLSDTQNKLKGKLFISYCGTKSKNKVANTSDVCMDGLGSNSIGVEREVTLTRQIPMC